MFYFGSKFFHSGMALVTGLFCSSVVQADTIRTAFNPDNYNTVISVEEDEVGQVEAIGVDDSQGIREETNNNSVTLPEPEDITIEEQAEEITTALTLSCGPAEALLTFLGKTVSSGVLEFAEQYSRFGSTDYHNMYGSNFPTSTPIDYKVTFNTEDSDNITMSQILAVTSDGSEVNITSTFNSELLVFSKPDLSVNNPTCQSYIINPARIFIVYNNYLEGRDQDKRKGVATVYIEAGHSNVDTSEVLDDLSFNSSNGIYKLSSNNYSLKFTRYASNDYHEFSDEPTYGKTVQYSYENTNFNYMQVPGL